MKIIKVELASRSYNILVGHNIIYQAAAYLKNLDIGCDGYVVTNPNIKKRYGSLLGNALKKAGFKLKFMLVADTEKAKSIECASSVIKGLAGFDKRGRRIFVVAFGGGVVGDLAGFVASIYKRGVPLVQVPTTLLAQVDSAIGGKTAVDLAQGKNLVGAFYQPRLVISDTAFLETLSRRQAACGLAEVIKYAVIKDARLFAYLQGHYRDILDLQPAALEYVVGCCSRIKAEIVRRDEKEELGLRTILNFGHTIGHAIEAAGGYVKYNHGEAIALGMVAALDISRRLGLLEPPLYEKITRLITGCGLPVKIKGLDLKAVINAHYRDKKFLGAKNRLVLVSGIGKAEIRENVPLQLIKQAIVKLR